jgi:hypothetical protein
MRRSLMTKGVRGTIPGTRSACHLVVVVMTVLVVFLLGRLLDNRGLGRVRLQTCAS